MSSLTARYDSFVSRRPERKELYKALVGLVVPICIQNLLGSLVSSVDIFMVSYVGQNELAALSLANQYMFILWGFFFGINSATSLMNSQYWGKMDTRAIQTIMGIGVKLGLVVTIIVSAACLFFPGPLMALYTPDASLIPIGVSYLRIVGASFILMAFSQTYLCTLRSVEQAKKSTIISTTTVIANVIGNAIFIFGLFGAPKLGVVGVAIATSLSRVIEFIWCVIDYAKGSMFKADLRLLFKHNATLFKDFLKYAAPALVNDLSWTIAFSGYSVILGHLSSDMVAASSVSTTLRDLFTAICYGLSAGGTVILGKELGQNDKERAKRDSATITWLILFATTILGIILVLLRHPLMSLFTSKLNEAAYGYLDIMMLINGYYMVGQAFNTFLITGVFRAGGNTKFGMICDTITMWGVSLPLGIITAFVLKWPPMWVYFVLCLDEFWKIPVVIRYYKSYKWLNNITRENVA